MNLVSLIKQEVCYISNNIMLRKIIIILILISIVFTYRTSVVSGELYNISRLLLIFIIVYTAGIIGITIYRFKTNKIYSNPPKGEMFSIILMLIYKLWNRVQACLTISISSLAIFMFIEISISGMIAEIFFFLGIYYNMTLYESHKIMLKFEQADDNHSDKEQV